MGCARLLLQLEGKVLRHGDKRRTKAETSGSRSDAGQRGAQGRAIKNLLVTAGKRAAVVMAQKQHGVSERRACRVTGLKAKANGDDKERLQQLAK
jgi:hypothetical protein